MTMFERPRTFAKSAYPTPVKLVRPPVSGATLSHAATIGLFVFALVAALWFAAAIAVPVAAAIVVGMVLGPFVDRLGRLGLPAFVAAAAVCLAAILLFHAVLAACALPLLGWIDRAPELWGDIRVKLEPLKEAVTSLGEVTKMVERAAGLDERGMVAVAGPGFLSNLATAAPAMVAEAIIFAGTLFFFLATRRDLKRAILGLCISRRTRLAAARIFTDSETVLSRYFSIITVINIGLGVATTLLAFLAGLPTPALWGVLAAVLNFAPYIGPALVTFILFMVSLATSDTIWQAAAVAGAFVALTTVEGQFITPAVLGRHHTLNPLLIFIAIAWWLWLWGPVGAFIAVPFLLIGTVAIDRLVGREAPRELMQRRPGRKAELRPSHRPVVAP